MSHLAGNWGRWASDCEARRTSTAGQSQPSAFGLTITGTSGAVLVRAQVDVASGDVVDHLADVVSIRRLS